MAHTHYHQHCSHANMRYCRDCQIPYCSDCGKEWGYRLTTGWTFGTTSIGLNNALGNLTGNLSATGTTDKLNTISGTHTHS